MAKLKEILRLWEMPEYGDCKTAGEVCAKASAPMTTSFKRDQRVIIEHAAGRTETGRVVRPDRHTAGWYVVKFDVDGAKRRPARPAYIRPLSGSGRGCDVGAWAGCGGPAMARWTLASSAGLSIANSVTTWLPHARHLNGRP
jgi:hypothetical protein